MKKILAIALTFMLLIGCRQITDLTTTTYSPYKPILMDRAAFDSAVHLYKPQPLDTVGKIQKLGDFLLVMELYKGLHVIDNTNPAQPQNESFLVIPGIIDFVVKDSFIYANSATDLLTLKFYSPNNIVLLDRQKDVFYELIPPDNRKMNPIFLKGNRPENTVIVGWLPDTNISFQDTLLMPYYLFATYSDYLFTTLGQMILVYDISSGIPEYKSSFKGNYNFIDKPVVIGDYLYTLTTTNLMIHYLSDPKNPVFVKEYAGINSGSYFTVLYREDYYFFVTYHYSPIYYIMSDNMQVYNLGSFNTTKLDTAITTSYALDVESRDSLLFLCDQGIRLFSFGSDNKLRELSKISSDALNIFLYDSLIVTLGQNSIRQYYLSDTSFTQLSSLPIKYAWTIKY